ncbi:MAG: MMPL family transporter [Solirubrobacteraceae bacterium]
MPTFYPGTPMTILARSVIRHSRKIAVLWCIMALCGAYCSSHLTKRLQNGGYDVPGSQSAKVVKLGKEKFGDKAEAQAYISVVAPAGSLATLLHDAALLAHAAQDIHGVDQVGTPVFSHNRRAALVPVMFNGSIGTAQLNDPAVERAIHLISIAPAKAELIGQIPVFNRYEVNAKKTLQRAAFISFPVTLVILLIAFLSAIAAALPLILALECIGVTLGLLYFLTYFFQLSVFVEDTVLILGLGLSIDFSLFIVTRVRESLARGSASIQEAITEALSTTGRAILVSGLTIAASLAGLFIVGVGFLGSLAIGAMGVTLVVTAAALTLTPASLVMLGHRLDRLPLRVAVSAAHRAALWQALAAFVVRRRVAIVAVVVPILLVLSIPVLGLSVRFKTFSILPSSDPVRKATTEVEKAFGPGFGAPVVILAKTSTGHLEESVEREPSIVESGEAQSGTQGWSRVTAVLRASPDSNSAEGYVHTLRTSLRGSLGRTALVGGPTAEGVDLADRINTRTPIVALVILIVELIVLTAAFRAPVIALKAAITTLLSVTATLGILSIIFGSGRLAYFVPLFLVAAVFGLSTDYEIFLLSRVREYYLEGLSTAESVQTALVRSARSITLAGITMSAVFFAFASSPLTPYIQLGVGLGLAVLMDVTIVRGLLVPATVALLGDANWWRPKFLLRTPRPPQKNRTSLPMG